MGTSKKKKIKVRKVMKFERRKKNEVELGLAFQCNVRF